MLRLTTFLVNGKDLHFRFWRIVLAGTRILIDNLYWILSSSRPQRVLVILCYVGPQLEIGMNARAVIAWTWQLSFIWCKVEFIRGYNTAGGLPRHPKRLIVLKVVKAAGGGGGTPSIAAELGL